MTTTAPRPHLKSPTAPADRPSPAEPTPSPAASSAPKIAAEGARSSVRSDPRAGDGRRPVAWLHVVAPPDWGATVEATSWCSCGRYDHATTRRGVLALVEAHTAHHDVCPLRRPATEGSKAA
jgi:hypothetical protein